MTLVLQALVEGRAFLDVRAPSEFADGAIPGAINLPILNDHERHQVGLCYKEQGSEQALTLGHQLVSGDTKAQRVQAWSDFVTNHPAGLLYCFRGGQRSALTQQWLHEMGIHIERIAGGYKAVRQQLLSVLATAPTQVAINVISGQTGSGKTRLLRQLMQKRASVDIIDLESLARHRGSAFGHELEEQPAQPDFENRLAVEFLRLGHRNSRSVWVEDESRTIGRIGLNEPLFSAMRQGPMAVIEEPLASRAQLILEEYVIDAYGERFRRDPETAYESLSESLRGPILKIHKSLGGSRAQEAMSLLNEALVISADTRHWSAHLSWIEFLLRNYYDAYYSDHIARQASRIVFRGSRLEVGDFMQQASRSVFDSPTTPL